MTTIREYAAQAPTWDHLYAIVFGWGWEEFAHASDPFDPTDDGRYVRDLTPDCIHDEGTVAVEQGEGYALSTGEACLTCGEIVRWWPTYG